MHLIDSNGATVTNDFTEGNAGLNIPATVVSAKWLNWVQREVYNFLSYLGIAPLTSGTDTQDQLLAGVREIFLRGGRAAPISQSIVNNQASAADVTNFPLFDKTVVRSIFFDFYLRRRTDSENTASSGTAMLTYNPESNDWDVWVQESIQSGVVFAFILDAGNNYKLQYTSDNMAGASYSSELKISNLRTIRI